MANTHESNLILAFWIEWRCPFVPGIRRSRVIGARLENRPNFRMGSQSIMFFEKGSSFNGLPLIQRWEIDFRWNF